MNRYENISNQFESTYAHCFSNCTSFPTWKIGWLSASSLVIFSIPGTSFCIAAAINIGAPSQAQFGVVCRVLTLKMRSAAGSNRSKLNSFWTHKKISTAAVIPIVNPATFKAVRLLLRIRLRHAVFR
jgi:hypothetical protein